jgi:putative FmdB family regulatory protein
MFNLLGKAQMPLYEYLCETCGVFEAWRPMVESAHPQACPDCDRPSPRAIARPHIRTARARTQYLAETRNEKSAHEPTIEHRLNGTRKHHHAHAKLTHVHAHQNHRPWMIGH